MEILEIIIDKRNAKMTNTNFYIFIFIVHILYIYVK